MTLKMIDILDFGLFFNEVKSSKLPFKVLYKLHTLTKAIEERTSFYQEKFQEILHEFGELDENGNLIPISDGNGIKIKTGTEQECMAKVIELQNLEIDLPDISFAIEEFGDIELTIDVFNAIGPFIKE